jgi:UDP:flavonoid glycosyltransferase YjiC (YdhE family)
MPELGHFQLLRPLIAGLARCNAEVFVLTHRRFETLVCSEGATFVDLFTQFPLEEADDASTPFSARYVTYAGHFGALVARELDRLQVSLVICETFALVGRVAAELLDLKWVNVSPGHDLNPDRFERQLRIDPRVQIAPSCERSVAILRDSHAMADASPFSFVTSLSPWLNICCEPPSFLEREQQAAYEPVVFFGSLPTEACDPPPIVDGSSSFADPARVKVYVSFGTVVWRYYRAEAVAALRVISRVISESDEMEALISLGHASIGMEECAQLTHANVCVASYVDQWTVLREADVFVTHHGINSTHEAIVNLVPMLSYPFFWDQPSLAAKCQQLGLAASLSETTRGPLTEESFRTALSELLAHRGERRAQLERARDAEIDVVAGRPEILRRLLSMAAATAS